MNESEMFEKVGRKQTELENLNAEYDRLLCVVSMMASGEVHPMRVSVDMKARTWKITQMTEPVKATGNEKEVHDS